MGILLSNLLSLLSTIILYVYSIKDIIIDRSQMEFDNSYCSHIILGHIIYVNYGYTLIQMIWCVDWVVCACAR